MLNFSIVGNISGANLSTLTYSGNIVANTDARLTMLIEDIKIAWDHSRRVPQPT